MTSDPVREMTPSRPYLIRAFYEWITDNGLTPHLLVNAQSPDVEVPTEHVHEGRIVLNLAPAAVRDLSLGNELIEFSARFAGTPRLLRVPPRAVLAIYARENGQGMAFGEDQGGGGGDEPPPSTPPERRPSLKVVK